MFNLNTKTIPWLTLYRGLQNEHKHDSQITLISPDLNTTVQCLNPLRPSHNTTVQCLAYVERKVGGGRLQRNSLLLDTLQYAGKVVTLNPQILSQTT